MKAFSFKEGSTGETKRCTLPETNMFAPENGWLEDDPFLLGRPIFRCELLVSGSVTNPSENSKNMFAENP